MGSSKHPLAIARRLPGGVAFHPVVGRILARLFGDRMLHHGCWIDSSSSAINPQLKASMMWGVYEKRETHFVRRYLRTDLDVIELGSSLGVVAAHIAKKLDAGRRLICVEANPQLLDSITRNVVANAPKVQLTVVHAALHYDSIARSTVPFRAADDHTASAVATARCTGTVEVPVTTLADIVRTADIGAYALVCDIEGAEAGLVHNELGALASCEQLIIELHDGEYLGARTTVQMLAERLQAIHGFTLRKQAAGVCCFDRLRGTIPIMFSRS